MHRKLWLTVVVAFLTVGIAFAEYDYDISGRWLLEGGGYAEKGVVRAQLTVEGDVVIQTKTENEVQYLTGYTVWARLDASRLNIKAWDYSDTVVFDSPIEIPELRPTTNQPFELPPVRIDDLTYQVTFTSTTSGTIEIYGDLNVDYVGTVEVNSESAIWKEGTARPDIPDESSGCNAGVGFSSMALLALLAKRRRG